MSICVKKSESKNDNSPKDNIEKTAKYIVMMKGAPEIIIKLCSQIRMNSGDEPLTTQKIDEFQV